MVDIIQKPAAIAERLYNTFTPIYAEWLNWDGAEEELRDEIDELTASDILEEDLMMLGLFIAAYDERSARIELGGVIDAMAFLRSADGEDAFTDYDAKMAQEELQMVQAAIADSNPGEAVDGLDLPLALRIAADMKNAGKKSNVEGLREAFALFIHCLVLRDGNVTDEEIDMAKKIEKLMRQMTAAL